MAVLDWSRCPGVESPGKERKAWLFRISRMPVKLVFANLEMGASIDEIIEKYQLSRVETRAMFGYVARSLDNELARGDRE